MNEKTTAKSKVGMPELLLAPIGEPKYQGESQKGVRKDGKKTHNRLGRTRWKMQKKRKVTACIANRKINLSSDRRTNKGKGSLHKKVNQEGKPAKEKTGHFTSAAKKRGSGCTLGGKIDKPGWYFKQRKRQHNRSTKRRRFSA